MAGDGLEDGGGAPKDGLDSKDGRAAGERRMVVRRGRAWLTERYTPDGDVPSEVDVADEEEDEAIGPDGRGPDGVLRIAAKPREVAVRDLKAERAGRVFPCLSAEREYTGCIGYEACTVLCWSPRPREREALVRVEQPTGGPCRNCVYAREVRGEVATINGREARLMECRLGYWHGRTTVHDFAFNKIALNVQLPCPGFVETETPHPAVAHLRETARRRKM